MYFCVFMINTSFKLSNDRIFYCTCLAGVASHLYYHVVLTLSPLQSHPCTNPSLYP